MCPDEPLLLDLPIPHINAGIPIIDFKILARGAFSFLYIVDMTDKRHERRVIEAGAILLDRQRVAALLNYCSRTEIVMHREAAAKAGESECIPANGSNRVVDAQVGDFYAAAPTYEQVFTYVAWQVALPAHLIRAGFIVRGEPGILYEICDSANRLGSGPCDGFALLPLPAENHVVVPQLADGYWRGAPQESTCADKADQRTRGKRSAAEAKNIDFVAFVVIFDKPIITVANVILQAESETAAGDGIEDTRANSPLVFLFLYPAVAGDPFRNQVVVM